MKTLHAITPFAIALGLALPVHADLSSNLVAYWTFDGCNGADATGRGHDLTMHGARPDACVRGPKGLSSAYPFNGVDNFGETLGGSEDFVVESAVTYAAWINPARYSGTIIHKFTLNPEFKRVRLAPDGTVRFYLYNCTGGIDLQSTSTVPINAWTHVAATFDGSFARLYLNGEPAGLLQTGNCNPQDSGGPLHVGGPDGQNNSALFQGAIDDARIYQRTLNDTEIRQLYRVSVPARILGTAPWETEHTVTCKNVTQGTEYVLPASKRDDWACESKNLQFAPGDTVQVIIDGTRK